MQIRGTSFPHKPKSICNYVKAEKNTRERCENEADKFGSISEKYVKCIKMKFPFRNQHIYVWIYKCIFVYTYIYYSVWGVIISMYSSKYHLNCCNTSSRFTCKMNEPTIAMAQWAFGTCQTLKNAILCTNWFY